MELFLLLQMYDERKTIYNDLKDIKLKPCAEFVVAVV